MLTRSKTRAQTSSTITTEEMNAAVLTTFKHYITQAEARRMTILRNSILSNKDATSVVELMRYFKCLMCMFDFTSVKQVFIAPENSSYNAFAEEVADALADAGFYTTTNLTTDPLNKKLEYAKQERYKFIVLIGQKTENGRILSIQLAEDVWSQPMSALEFITQNRDQIIKKQIQRKHRWDRTVILYEIFTWMKLVAERKISPFILGKRFIEVIKSKCNEGLGDKQLLAHDPILTDFENRFVLTVLRPLVLEVQQIYTAL